jgi:putative ABC transport system substrate-binding protein
MNRREFITLLGGAAAVWPLAARAQQAKRPIVGFLGDSTPLGENERAAAFARRLQDLGWIEGRTIAIGISLGRRAQRALCRNRGRVFSA